MPIYADSREDKGSSVCKSHRIVTMDRNTDISKDHFKDL